MSSLSEFDIIRQYFSDITTPHDSIVLGVGDDAAILSPQTVEDWIVCLDTLHADKHFWADDPPDAIAHKALAANLSDVAAMGAKPVAFLFSLSLPSVDAEWISLFAQGLKNLAHNHGVSLIGGDTTQGPLSVSITVLGQVDKNKALRRSGASVGDKIYVSGVLGAAAASLQDKTYPAFRQAYCYPTPQIALGQALIGVAHACIDISDGLCADLSHVLSSSDVGAEIFVDTLPVQADVQSRFSIDEARRFALTGGDDYQLLFTTDAGEACIKHIADTTGVSLTCVGTITQARTLKVMDAQGETLPLTQLGFEHFKDDA